MMSITFCRSSKVIQILKNVMNDKGTFLCYYEVGNFEEPKYGA